MKVSNRFTVVVALTCGALFSFGAGAAEPACARDAKAVQIAAASSASTVVVNGRLLQPVAVRSARGTAGSTTLASAPVAASIDANDGTRFTYDSCGCTGG